MEKLTVFKFNDAELHFDLGNDVYVNATEMAAMFGSKPSYFLELEETKEFIKALEMDFQESVESAINCRPGRQFNSDVTIVKTIQGRSGGTWFHELLAIRYAQYLSPKFSIWIMKVIRDIMAGNIGLQKEAVTHRFQSIHLKKQIEQVEAKLINTSPDYQMLMQLKKDLSAAKKSENRAWRMLAPKQLTFPFA